MTTPAAPNILPESQFQGVSLTLDSSPVPLQTVSESLLQNNTVPSDRASVPTDEPIIPVGVPKTGTPDDEPVNQVNGGNLASLPQTEPDGITSGVVSKTFKVPAWAYRTIEKAVRELNDNLPDGVPQYTTHSYGVDLLTNHENLRQSAFLVKQLDEKCRQLLTANDLLKAETHRKSIQVNDLMAQLKEAQGYINRLEHVPTHEPVLPPVHPQETTAVVNPQLEQLYNTLVTRFEKLQAESQGYEHQLAVIRPLLDQLPNALSKLSREAARNSYYSPAYYEQFFQDLIQPFLPLA